MKKYLHPDEIPFFVRGEGAPVLEIHRARIAFAICYELSVDEHLVEACQFGANVYIPSAAKTRSDVDIAAERLSGIAKKYSMTVLMSNCTGECDGGECAGHTSAWDHRGRLLGRLNERDEGLLLVETCTQEILARTEGVSA